MTETTLRITSADVEFVGADIRGARLIEEFSPLSVTLPASNLELALFSDDPAFSVINPAGKYEVLTQQEPLVVYEDIDGEEHYVGQYFVDKWANTSESIKSFSCVDIIGFLDRYEYYGGIWLTPITAADLLADILTNVSMPYILDPMLADIELTGWIPICSYREALQQVLFALSAYILVPRQSIPLIGRVGEVITMQNQGRPRRVTHTGQSRVFQVRWRSRQSIVYNAQGTITAGVRTRPDPGAAHAGQSRLWQQRFRQSQWAGASSVVAVPSTEQSGRKLDLRQQVTGIEMLAHDIVPGEGALELFNGDLVAGTHEIRFAQPMRSLAVNGATITTSGANYAILTVASPGKVTLSGLVYVDTTKLFSQYLGSSFYKQENVLKVTNAGLINSTNASEVLSRLFSYYQQRYVQRVKLFHPVATLGRTVNMETLYGNNLFGVIEKVATNLAGGNIADTTVVGIIGTPL